MPLCAPIQGGNTVPVQVDGSGVTQPVSGMVASTQGSPGVVADAWPTMVTDGVSTTTVKAASTTATSADAALTVVQRDPPPVHTGTPTDHSGTIATGGTSQQPAAANASRRMLLIAAPAAASEPVYFQLDGTAAVVGEGICLGPGAAVVFDMWVPAGAVTVTSTTAGTPFTCYEG